MIRAASVQFSGNAKVYLYSLAHLPAEPEAGDRVVVPNKLKDDGTLSLTIANVVAVGDHDPDGTTAVLPVVCVIPLESIVVATQLMPKAAEVCAAILTATHK